MRNSERCTLMIVMATASAIGCVSNPMVTIICALIASAVLGFFVLSEVRAVLRIRDAAKRNISKSMVLIDNINDYQMFARQLHRERQWRYMIGGTKPCRNERLTTSHSL